MTYKDHVEKIHAKIQELLQLEERTPETADHEYLDKSKNIISLRSFRRRSDEKITSQRSEHPVAILSFNLAYNKDPIVRNTSGNITAFIYVNTNIGLLLMDFNAMVMQTPVSFFERGMSITFGSDPRAK